MSTARLASRRDYAISTAIWSVLAVAMLVANGLHAADGNVAWCVITAALFGLYAWFAYRAGAARKAADR